MSAVPRETPHPDDRYAAWLRCSDEELQDPHLSLDRQLRNCTVAVEGWGGQIVAVYYDIETGATRLDQRGHGDAAERFGIPIPRAGGLHDLMSAATTTTPRGFDRVVCENIDRLARSSAVAFTIDEDLRTVGVRLHCADEPFEESFGSILLRHVNAGLARGYLYQLKLRTRQGFETGTRQGWNMAGPPCYGFQFVQHPHPNPHKAKLGLARHTLTLDPARAPVVRRIFDWYLYGHRSISVIARLLNADLDANPPPVASDPARSRGAWTPQMVWGILHNPKSTGYQVWNRRAAKTGGGRVNPPDRWVWSEQPAHPAIITVEEFNEITAVADRNVTFRDRLTPQHAARPTDPAAASLAAPTYLFDQRLTCGLCQRPMWGHQRLGRVVYQCRTTRRRDRDRYPHHPRVVALSEQQLTAAVIGYLAAEVFVPDRLERWRHALAGADPPAPATAEIDHDIEGAVNLGDLEHRFRQGRLNLDQFRRCLVDRIDRLDAQGAQRRAATQAAALDPAALGRLRTVARRRSTRWGAWQTELGALLDRIQLGGVYHPDRHEVALTITLPAQPDPQPPGIPSAAATS